MNQNFQLRQDPSWKANNQSLKIRRQDATSSEANASDCQQPVKGNAMQCYLLGALEESSLLAVIWHLTAVDDNQTGPTSSSTDNFCAPAGLGLKISDSKRTYSTPLLIKGKREDFLLSPFP